MRKQIEQSLKSAPRPIDTQISLPIPPSPRPARALLSLPLPLPDYRRVPRWPAKDSRPPEVVLYFVDYALSDALDRGPATGCKRKPKS